MKYYQLPNTVKIPQIAFGTWRLPDAPETVNTIKTALSAGYRHIDTAAKYENEASVGQAVRESEVPRDQIFVTSKLRNTQRGYETTLADFDRALRTMKLDYLDLYMIHWPAGSAYYTDWDQINLETWQALEKLYHDGKVRAIGISNFWPHHIKALTDHCEIPPMVCQLKFHPGFTQPEASRFCQYSNMLVEAYSPLGAGKLLTSPVLLQLAEKYKKSTAQICIRWCLQHNVLPIPKSSNLERMKQNLDVYDFNLSNEEMLMLDELDPQLGNEVRDPDKLNLD